MRDDSCAKARAYLRIRPRQNSGRSLCVARVFLDIQPDVRKKWKKIDVTVQSSCLGRAAAIRHLLTSCLLFRGQEGNGYFKHCTSCSKACMSARSRSTSVTCRSQSIRRRRISASCPDILSTSVRSELLWEAKRDSWTLIFIASRDFLSLSLLFSASRRSRFR